MTKFLLVFILITICIVAYFKIGFFKEERHLSGDFVQGIVRENSI